MPPGLAFISNSAMLFYYQRHEMLAQSAKIKYLRFMYKSWKGSGVLNGPVRLKYSNT